MFRSGFVVYLMLSICAVDASIEIFDKYGRKVETFPDREAPFDDDFVTMEGFMESATPPDACSSLAPPSFLTNFTMGRFVLINGSEDCGFMLKVRNAEKAGYDVAVIFDPFPAPFQFNIRTFPIPSYELNLQVVLISYGDGVIIRNNYLYNHSYEHNFLIKLRPNTPDITYYMYLFGAVIGVCFFVMLLFMMCLLIKCIQEKRRSRRNRLSSRQIKQIPTAKFTKGDQYDVCAICLEDYNEGDKLRILPCSHAYHSKCIDPWLMNNRRNCPLCKRKITFGDSGDESDSEDSELTSPAENTPLLSSPSNTRAATSWGTFVVAVERPNNGSGPSAMPSPFPHIGSASAPTNDDSENPFLSADDDMEGLLPPPVNSINGGVDNLAVVFNEEVNDDLSPSDQPSNRLFCSL
ncbi:hypothetical protein JTE90_005860 [Oedothorax gibbosus]|uniref:RING-type domain-containing protein n=1 Tax=Oedothorax gibbosus TaxID=931172 RepID=A0AAV6URJ0_9ARAC|nr:hypothetical protein JTE90_005860 [Oedothorax gibbosus]